MRLQYRIFVATTGLDERLEIGVDALRRSSGLSDAIGLQVEAQAPARRPRFMPGRRSDPSELGCSSGS
jgi:hypothetical protein